MNIVDTLIRLRDDLKEWTRNNLIELKSNVPSSGDLDILENTLENKISKLDTRLRVLEESKGTNADETDLIKEGTIYLNQRYSESKGGLVEEKGRISIKLPINTDVAKTYELCIKDTLLNMETYKDLNRFYIINADGTVDSSVNGSTYFGYMTEGWTYADNKKGGTCIFTMKPIHNYIYVVIVIKNGTSDNTVVEEDLGNMSIILKPKNE